MANGLELKYLTNAHDPPSPMHRVASTLASGFGAFSITYIIVLTGLASLCIQLQPCLRAATNSLYPLLLGGLDTASHVSCTACGIDKVEQLL